MNIVQPRLETLIPNLLNWSHEHKAHLQAKVKHIFERMVRRFGVEEVEKWTPDSDKKLIANIRKTRERRKKKKSAAEDDAENDGDDRPEPLMKRKSKFESGYDEAVYGSDNDSSDAGSDVSDDEVLGRKQRKGKNERDAYIVEDEDEPLDLLDRRALGNISSTKPLKKAAPQAKRKAKVDLDGKLVLGGDDDNDVSMRDAEADTGPNLDEAESGINAYVDAIKGGNAPRRGQKGKLKFSNKPRKEDDDEDDGMALDGDDNSKGTKKIQSQLRTRGSGASFARGRGGRGGGMKAARMQRKGLGVEKTRGGRVGKGSPGRAGRL
jgi:ribosomal RNA-processing protein 12